MKHVDILYNTIQEQSANAVTISNALQHFESAVSVIRENTERYQVYEDKCSAPSRKKCKHRSEVNLTVDSKVECVI